MEKMHDITKPATPSDINHVCFIILDSFSSLRFKAKSLHVTQLWNDIKDHLKFTSEHIECQLKYQDLASIFSQNSMHYHKGIFLTIVLGYIFHYEWFLKLVDKQFIELTQVVLFIVKIGPNQIFYFQKVQKATSVVDFIIANCLERLLLPIISIPPCSTCF